MVFRQFRDRRQGAEDRSLRTVAIYPAFAAFEDSVMAAVVPTLDEKASKYGQLDAPHVIAAAHRRGLWTSDRQRRDRPAAVLAAGSWDFNVKPWRALCHGCGTTPGPPTR